MAEQMEISKGVKSRADKKTCEAAESVNGAEGTDDKPAPKTKPETPEPKANGKGKVKADVKAVAKAKPKAEPKTKTKAEAKAKAKAEPKAKEMPIEAAPMEEEMPVQALFWGGCSKESVQAFKKPKQNAKKATEKCEAKHAQKHVPIEEARKISVKAMSMAGEMPLRSAHFTADANDSLQDLMATEKVSMKADEAKNAHEKETVEEVGKASVNKAKEMSLMFTASTEFSKDLVQASKAAKNAGKIETETSEAKDAQNGAEICKDNIAQKKQAATEAGKQRRDKAFKSATAACKQSVTKGRAEMCSINEESLAHNPHVCSSCRLIDNTRAVLNIGWCFQRLIVVVVLCAAAAFAYTPANRAELISAVGDYITNPTSSRGPIENWNTSKVTDMNSVFFVKTNFNGPIGSWDVSRVTKMDSMFYTASSFNQDLGKWNTAKVSSMAFMFYVAQSFNQDIDNWNIARVQSMYGMFYAAKAFNPASIQGWNVNQKDQTSMFCSVPSCRPTWYLGDTCTPNPGLCGTSACEKGHYCPSSSSKFPCPAGTFTKSYFLTDVAQCTPCQPGTFCLSGSPAESHCSTGTYNDITGQSKCKKCPAGKKCSKVATITPEPCDATGSVYCPEGTSTPLSCPQGKYVLATLDGCLECPTGSWSTLKTDGASEIKRQCLCTAGHYDANDDPSNRVCDRCPDDAICEYGSTLRSLELKHGFWRVSPTSLDIQKCPDARNNLPTSCTNKNGSICAEGLSGVFCKVCEDSTHFYVSGTESKSPTCRPCSDRSLAGTIQWLVAFGLLVLVVIVAILAVICKRCGCKEIEITGLLRGILHRPPSFLTLRTKLNIIISFYMVATRIEDVYKVQLPSVFSDVLRYILYGLSLGLEKLLATELQCFGVADYRSRLMVCLVGTSWMPILLLAASMLGGRSFLKNENAGSTKNTEGGSTKNINASCKAGCARYFWWTIPWLLRIDFLLFPIVSNTAFQAFPCYDFKDGDQQQRWLIADVNVKCGSPQHTEIIGLAWATICVYCFGTSAASLVMLFRGRRATQLGVGDPQYDQLYTKERQFSETTKVLHQSYHTACFWWELVERLRRFILVGIFVMVQPGSLWQLVLANAFSTGYLMVQVLAKPFRNLTDNIMAMMTSFTLVLLFNCSILLQGQRLAGASDEEVDTRTFYAVLGISVFGCLGCATVVVIGHLFWHANERSKQPHLKYVGSSNGWDSTWDRVASLVSVPRLREGLGRLGLVSNLVSVPKLNDGLVYHIFLSHAWPSAQDRMRVIKDRLKVVLPGINVFLDVDNLQEGSGINEIDQSECILAFCTKDYFKKRNSMKELYRAVVKGKRIIACLEPDASQQGGVGKHNINEYITEDALKHFLLKEKFDEWQQEHGRASAFLEAPTAEEVIAALFKTPPVEWSRIPAFQDVTIRLIVQKGLQEYLHKNQEQQGEVELQLQGEVASKEVKFHKSRHIFVSNYNPGARELSKEIKCIPQITNPNMLSFDDIPQGCDAMLLLLNKCTWDASTDEAVKRKKDLVKDVISVMRAGHRIILAHEAPSLLPDRHFDRYACEFDYFFKDEVTPLFLRSGAANVYKTIAVRLQSNEWRNTGLVTLAEQIQKTPDDQNTVSFALEKVLDEHDPDAIVRWRKSLRESRGLVTVPGVEDDVAESNRAEEAEEENFMQI